MAMMTPKEHIDHIRKTKFSIGGEPNPLIEDLHQSVKNLSAELYSKDAHFLMEIIQNAEDNVYDEGVKPSLEFIVTSQDITRTGATSTLLVFNNEKGFSPKNIESISSVGRSTKKGQRQQGYIGEKGIGFKSVFLITAQPYIFSNGYQIRFNEEPDPYCNLGYIVPEWIEENPTLGDIKSIYGSNNKSLPATTIVLPLKHDKEQVVKLQLSSIHPEVLLFLSKIRQLSVREDNKDSKLNTVSAISISSETEFVSRKNVSAESYTLHLSADEDCDDSERECSYYMWRQKFPVNQENRVERRMEVDDLVITLAFPNGKRLNRGRKSPGIYAFLPTEMVTNFPFIIQADFLLASSREEILHDNKWNIGILNNVPSAFVNAFVSLVKTSGAAPISSLARMFEFLPVDSSSYLKLNIVRDSIKGKLLEENIVPSESYTAQKLFHKPSEVGRIVPAFWDILIKAREKGVSLHNLSSHGTYALNFAFDTEYYDDILDFLEVKYMDGEWYAKCIRSSNLVLGLSEDVYLELLFFVADNWTAFQLTNMKGIPLLKYVGQQGQVYLGSVKKVTKWRVRKLCLLKSARHISWLIDWNKEFRCAPCYFMPKGTQEALQSFHQGKPLKKWLSDHVEASFVSLNNYADLLLNSLGNEGRLVVVFVHFLCQSLLKKYVSQNKVEILCKKMPLLDNYACVTTQKSGVLIPANGSKWAGLIRSNPWKGKNFVELGEDYLHAGNYAGEYTSKEDILMFLKTHVQASDIPDLCPPDDAFPAVSSPLTKENTFFLLEWIRNLKCKEMLVDGNFLRCIKQGSWLRTYVGNSVGYRPPSQSFLLTPSWGNLLKDGSEMVDIPLIDQQFYDNRILDYKDELITIGVMTEFGEACQFIGKHLMFLAAIGNLTRANVYSILNFIKILREKYLPPDDFVESLKEGHWLRTSCGEQSPVGAVLFDSEWKAASKISNLPFVDEEYYGTRILSFRTELQLLGVVVGFDRNYQRLADCFRMPTSFASMTWDDISLILECVRYLPSSDQLVAILKSKQWLKTTEGFKSPSECFLFDSDWGCLLQIFPGFPVISEKSYGDQVFSYKNELRKLGVVIDFEEAAKQFSRQFKELASLGSITKDNVLLFLECLRTLKKTSHQFPLELKNSIRDEKWLRTRLGQRSPEESILFSSDWEYLAPIALLPFIDDSEVNYGTAIQDYKEELKAIGVVVEFEMGSKFVAAGLCFPQNPTDIAPSSVRSLLECISYIMKDQDDSLPEEFLGRANKRWLKTYMGYRKPNECLLFGPEWKSLLQCDDASFIDDKFYGFDVTSYKKELNAIGVVVDVKNGCQLLAEQLQSHSKYDVIARIYMYLSEYDWKPKNEASNWIWIPSGNDGVHWVSSEVCVLYDKDALFGLQLNVLDKYYERKFLAFFSMALDVRQNPSVDDYLRLWKTWENLEYQLTPAECCAFWKCIVKHWNSKTKGLLAEMMKLPVTRDADIILLVNKQDVFIPDDLLLVDLFEKSSPDLIFIWYPQPSLPSLPRTKLHEIYSSIGVQPISKSVQRTELSTLDGEVMEVSPREVLIKRGLIRLVLGFLSDPSIDMDANKRQSSVKALLNVNVLKTEELISASYTLSLASGKSINVKACEMIRWERESSKMFIQKISKLSGQKVRCQFATYFSKVIAEGMLWEKEDRIAELSDLIKLGWLLKFEEEEIEFLLKSKNLQIFMEDEEFLKSAFTAE